MKTHNRPSLKFTFSSRHLLLWLGTFLLPPLMGAWLSSCGGSTGSGSVVPSPILGGTPNSVECGPNAPQNCQFTSTDPKDPGGNAADQLKNGDSALADAAKLVDANTKASALQSAAT